MRILALVLPVLPALGVGLSALPVAPERPAATREARSLAPPASRPARDTAQDPDAIVRRADQALAGLRTLRAAFVQQVRNPLLEKTTTGRGTLSYKAPRRFRIAYSDPAGDVIVHDGARVWIYLPSSQPGQVIRQPASASGVQNPLTYLRDLRDPYDARHVGVETVAGAAADRLRLVPRSGRAEFTGIEVWVDQGTGLLRRLRTKAEDGVVTTYTFTTLQRNVPLSDTLFRFTPPRGVEVFDP